MVHYYSSCYRYVVQALVLQSDFGLVEGTVAQMYGVSLQVEPRLQIYDLTHNIPAFDTWSASYSLYQSILSWPAGTIFVSVVDPGVGSDRKSVIVHTVSDHYVVTPDNGTLTHIVDRIGIDTIRKIDEGRHRRPGSEGIHVFHGRDLYAYSGAKLAAGLISFEDVGPNRTLDSAILHPLRPPCKIDDDGIEGDDSGIEGMIEIDDRIFGMAWSNIPLSMINEMGLKYGQCYEVEICHQDRTVYSATIPYERSFSYVSAGEELLYLNEIGNLAIATNLGSFIEKHGVSYGYDWIIRIRHQTKEVDAK